MSDSTSDPANDPADLLDLPEIYRETLCMHSALRTLGVRSEHIFFSVSPGNDEVATIETTDGGVSTITSRATAGATVMVVVKPGGIEGDPLFTVGIGAAPDDFCEVWPEACRRWGTLSREEAQRVWEASNVRRNVAALVTALTLSGVMRGGRVMMAAPPPATDMAVPAVNSRGGQG